MHLKVNVSIFIYILNLYLNNLYIIYILIEIFYNVAASTSWAEMVVLDRVLDGLWPRFIAGAFNNFNDRAALQLMTWS